MFLEKLIEVISKDGIGELSGLKGWAKDKEGEPIDMENYEVRFISEEYMTLFAGGDWQEQKVMKIALVDDDLEVVEISEA